MCIRSCKKEFDLIVVNGPNAHKEIKTQLFYNRNDVLSKIAGHMSWISSLIIHKNMLNNLVEKISNYSYNAFPHLIAILLVLDVNCRVSWISETCIKAFDVQFCGYSKNAMKYFFVDWYEIILIIGDLYSLKDKKMFLNDNIIGCKGFFGNRIKGILTKESFDECKRVLYYYPRGKKYIVCGYISLLIPIKFLKIIYYFYRYLRGDIKC